jgi:hypothetical protein
LRKSARPRTKALRGGLAGLPMMNPITIPVSYSVTYFRSPVLGSR